MPISRIIFDVGETLVCERRLWQGWAAYLGVSEGEFVAAVEDVIARGEHHRAVFDRLRPGLDAAAARRERAARGDVYRIEDRDLYPDARACLRELRRLGY